MRANLKSLLPAMMIQVLCCTHSYGQRAPEIKSCLVFSDFAKIIQGMTYQQVTGILGKPCFEKTLPDTQPWIDRVWRTAEGESGLYVTFREGKVVGIATFKRDDPIITFKKGDYNSRFITDKSYQGEILGLLGPANGPEISSAWLAPASRPPSRLGAAPLERAPVKVTYASGRTIMLRNWAFDYLFIESERPRTAGTYPQSRRSDQALLIRVPGKMHSNESPGRRIEAKDLKSILFGWDFAEQRPLLKKIIVETRAGESLILRDTTSGDHNKWSTGDLTPATGLLSKALYVFGAGYCPCIILKGQASDGTLFENVISAMEQRATLTQDDVISLVSFQ